MARTLLDTTDIIYGDNDPKFQGEPRDIQGQEIYDDWIVEHRGRWQHFRSHLQEYPLLHEHSRVRGVLQ